MRLTPAEEDSLPLLGRRWRKRGQFTDIERFDHIFSPDEAQAVKECLTRIAGGRGAYCVSIARGWQAILTEAHRWELRRYEYESPRKKPDGERGAPMKKQRFGRLMTRFLNQPVALAIVRGDRLKTKRVGKDFVDVRIVRVAKMPRGRPKGGVADLDGYISVVCRVYERLSGRRAAWTWDSYGPTPRARGPLLELLHAALRPEAFPRLSSAALVSAVRRVRQRSRIARR